MKTKETQSRRSVQRPVRRLFSVIGNPWTDKGGNYRVMCPDCDKRMRLVSWPRYWCGKCGSYWDVVK